MRTLRLWSRPMARIRPFEALRYDVPDLADVVAPPYDVLSAEDRAAYRARSPYNVVHLTLPDSEDEAARSLADWRASGVLVRDRSEEHTSELQSPVHLVCRLLLEKKKKIQLNKQPREIIH